MSLCHIERLIGIFIVIVPHLGKYASLSLSGGEFEEKINVTHNHFLSLKYEVTDTA